MFDNVNLKCFYAIPKSIVKTVDIVYFFDKGKCTAIFQVRSDIMPEVNRLIGKHLFPSVGSNTWLA